MRVRTRRGWRGEVAHHVPVTSIDVDAGETLTIEPSEGQRAIVLLVPDMEMRDA